MCECMYVCKLCIPHWRLDCKNHSLLMTLMTKINALFMTKMAEKPLFGTARTSTAHIREYSSPGQHVRAILNVHLFISCGNYFIKIYGVFTKCEVKLAGYEPSSFYYVRCLPFTKLSQNPQPSEKNNSNTQVSWPKQIRYAYARNTVYFLVGCHLAHLGSH